ncbi:ABC transporter substrate-binding protein [Sulfitobacter guttiformis]|uniref:Peptide/nickel transport system substrate-binding protein n=1 Tax=Sulfitobacter guttiformis TaxID=74349 RepID=A0A420DP11_9RHOB|nr:ABC transporter substrate-binding protein [Sulfitobacter guttiformis]KIN73295.1 ABC-type dipeptide transport system, periplasmic component [Sulfitobacter guttiformis KCTC 32187]RKE95965.1 peptide/nickel transport system substrate-binding protein [Sulfitobacter guttiformis]
MIIAQPRLGLHDPHDCTDATDELTILHAIYDTLVRRVGQDFVPHLAQRWEVSTDARQWTFYLQPDVTFHDGTRCDAGAVSACLTRMAREDKGYTLGAPAVWRQFLGGAQIDVLDERTLQLTLAAPMADLLDVLEQGFVVAPSAFAALDAEDFSVQIGSGPYRLIKITQTQITAERIAGHFAGEAANARVTWQLEADPQQRLELLEQGKVQAAIGLDFEKSRRLGEMRHEFLSPVAIIYLLNAARGPLADANVRLALSLAVDREALITTVMQGAAHPLRGFVSPNHFGAGQGNGAVVDRDRAMALLAEAGYAEGLTLNVDCPTRLPDEAERLTAALGDQLAQVGIKLQVFIHPEREDYAHMVRLKEIRDLCVFDSSPMSTYRVLFEKIDSRVAGSWWQGYANPKVEALIDAGRVTTKRFARAEIWREAYKMLQDDPAWLTLYNPLRVIGLAGKHPDFKMPADGVIDVARLPKLSGA